MAKKKTLSPTFLGYECKGPSCSGHKAGYRYARNGGGIPSPHSRSFNEGMDAYVTKATAPTQVKPKSLVTQSVLGAVAAGAALGAKKGG